MLAPLAAPPSDERSTERIAQTPAVQLFVDRARAVAPDFALQQENAPAIAEAISKLGTPTSQDESLSIDGAIDLALSAVVGPSNI